MVTFQCDSGDSCHRINVTHKTLQVVEQPWQDVVEQFYVSQTPPLSDRRAQSRIHLPFLALLAPDAGIVAVLKIRITTTPY